MCSDSTGIAPPYFAYSDVSVPLLGISCRRVTDALRDQNGSLIARALRIAIRLAEEIP